MKIRYGFVSNSSSTSFSIYGIYVKNDGETINKFIGEPKETKSQGCQHEFNRDKAKFCPECGNWAWNIETEARDIDDLLEKYFTKKGLDIEFWTGGENCCEGMYVGKNLQNNKFNELSNKIEILRDIEKKLKDMFPGEFIRFYSDAGYNG